MKERSFIKLSVGAAAQNVCPLPLTLEENKLERFNQESFFRHFYVCG
jgi:hypothetical protein